MIEYNRRMRQQLAVMREAANRGAQTCSLALLPSPQPSHTRGSVHTHTHHGRRARLRPRELCPLEPVLALARLSFLACSSTVLSPRVRPRSWHRGLIACAELIAVAGRDGRSRTTTREAPCEDEVCESVLAIRSVFSPGRLVSAQPLAGAVAPAVPRLGVAITGVGKRGRGTGA